MLLERLKLGIISSPLQKIKQFSELSINWLSVVITRFLFNGLWSGRGEAGLDADPRRLHFSFIVGSKLMFRRSWPAAYNFSKSSPVLNIDRIRSLCTGEIDHF